MSFSLEKKHIAVVYHYIEDPRQDRKGIHPCPPDEFERQVKFLKEQYRIVTLEELFAGARESSHERLCALTFDDGLRDQYTVAFPILERHGVSGTFFVIGETLDGNMPETHMIHMLFSVLEPKTLVGRYHDFVAIHFSEKSEELAIPTDRYLNEARRHSDVYTANFKERMLSLPEEVRERFITWMKGELHLDSTALVQEFFMGESEVRNLARRGGVVGSHAHHHRSFDSLSKEEIGEEVHTARDRLAAILGVRPTSFSYPHGRVGRVRSESVELLDEAGFTNAVTTEKREVRADDHPLLIPRYNENDIRDFLRARQ